MRETPTVTNARHSRRQQEQKRALEIAGKRNDREDPLNANNDTRKPMVIALVALMRLLFSVALILLAVKLSYLAGLGMHTLVEEAAALKWVTAAATTMAGGAIVIAVQSFPEVIGALPEFLRSFVEADWRKYLTRCWGLIKPLIASVLILTFAAVFVVQEAERISIEVVDVKALARDLAKGITHPIEEKISKLPDEGQTKRLVGNVMEEREYTRERALLLDNLRGLSTAGGTYHFARFAVLFPTASPLKGTTPENLDLGNVRFEQGVTLENKGRALVDRVVKAMIPCGATRKVELIIEGYASSAPFTNFEAHSEALNLEAANQRGKNLKAAIETAIGADFLDRFEISLITHPSLDAMQQVRGFNDRPDGVVRDDARPQDLMTRAAHIKIAHAGGCAPIP